MKCVCEHTRPRFILSSEGVLGGMEFEPMLTPREKSPLPENFPRGGSNPQHCGQRAQALPTELFRPPRAVVFRGFPTRMVYLYYISCLRYTILVGNSRFSPSGKRSEERKRPTFHPPRSRTICVQLDKYWHCFEGNLGETAESWGGARMGLSERYDEILS